MAIVQLTCPETGKPVDILEVPAGAFQAAVLSSTEIPCPHCGKTHLWTSGDLGLSDASAPRLTRGEPRTRRGWLGDGSSIEQRSSGRASCRQSRTYPPKSLTQLWFSRSWRRARGAGDWHVRP